MTLSIGDCKLDDGICERRHWKRWRLDDQCLRTVDGQRALRNIVSWKIKKCDGLRLFVNYHRHHGMCSIPDEYRHQCVELIQIKTIGVIWVEKSLLYVHAKAQIQSFLIMLIQVPSDDYEFGPTHSTINLSKFFIHRIRVPTNDNLTLKSCMESFVLDYILSAWNVNLSSDGLQI